MNNKDLYFVAVKVLLRHGNKLLITHDIFGSWDLPGGRIKVDEFDTPLEKIIERKLCEELGEAMTFKIGEVKVFFRVERAEQNLGGQKVRIFAVGYEAEYLGGDITLGKHHDSLEWVDVGNFKPADYFTGGWLAGVQNYVANHED